MKTIIFVAVFLIMTGNAFTQYARKETTKTAITFKNQNNRNDKFIDNDSDGVCDNRATGLGLRHRHRYGQKIIKKEFLKNNEVIK